MDLGEIMNQLLLWLDNEKIRVTAFKTEPNAGGYIRTIGFRSVEDAALFRAQFDT